MSHTGSNRIRTVNGVAFANLPQLKKVNLRSNLCINIGFSIDCTSNKFRRKISRNCGLSDDTKKELSCSASKPCHVDQGHSYFLTNKDPPSCCEMEYGTLIDSPDYTFVADANYTNIEILTIAYQQNVEFLPVSVHRKFPNLKIYYVIKTAIPRISKNNFEKLYNLIVLRMVSNQIEVIKSDTFEDLINLEYFILSK